ncbi:MAG: hypothetical protein ABIJ08_02165 [Nanoarchaeota archaeon]
MQYKNIFNLNNEITWKSMTMLFFLAIMPNFLGMINIETQWGFKIHFFQYLIFLAAVIYGPTGGLISGAFGSFYTSITMNNPYIAIGNMILGLFVGLLVRLRWNMILAVLTAYLIQLPWLYYSDIYLAHMPFNVVIGVIIALSISNTIWAIMTRITYKQVKRLIE